MLAPQLLPHDQSVHTIHANVIRLHMHTLDLAILRHQRIPLTPEVTKQRTRIKVQIQGLDEFAIRVSDVADVFGAAGGVEGGAPGFHNEGVVDGDDEDFGDGFGLVGVDVAGDVGFGAGGACEG